MHMAVIFLSTSHPSQLLTKNIPTIIIPCVYARDKANQTTLLVSHPPVFVFLCGWVVIIILNQYYGILRV